MGLTAPLSAGLPESLESSGVQGGLVVHLNCGDGQGTATLLTSDRFVVHGLDTDAADVAKGREFLQGQGIYGNVSLAVFDAKSLPYVDNLVNLVISECKPGVSEQEIMRVLALLGVAMIGDKKVVKPCPPTSTTGRTISRARTITRSPWTRWSARRAGCNGSASRVGRGVTSFYRA